MPTVELKFKPADLWFRYIAGCVCPTMLPPPLWNPVPGSVYYIQSYPEVLSVCVHCPCSSPGGGGGGAGGSLARSISITILACLSAYVSGKVKWKPLGVFTMYGLHVVYTSRSTSVWAHGGATVQRDFSVSGFENISLGCSEGECFKGVGSFQLRAW